MTLHALAPLSPSPAPVTSGPTIGLLGTLPEKPAAQRVGRWDRDAAAIVRKLNGRELAELNRLAVGAFPIDGNAPTQAKHDARHYREALNRHLERARRPIKGRTQTVDSTVYVYLEVERR